MFWIGLLLILISIILLLVVHDRAKNIHKINTETDKINKEIEKENQKLVQEKETFLKEISAYQQNLINIQQTMQSAGITAEEACRAMRQNFENYEILLDKEYQEKEEEYDNLLKDLYNAYDEEQVGLLDEIQEIKENLEYLRSTRAAAIQAQIKEKEIKEQSSFYCLNPTENELDDIKALERVKPNLHQPRILCMLIWSTYFQKPMTALCNNVLGTTTVTGIYKITNQETGECYIGQAVDVAKRWKDHAKCGLGIDTPASNKLYKAIQEYGIWNFSWELLEKCTKEFLDEKELFYIDLYDSKNYGYNSSIGIKKN
jgi:hypothetical protein